MPSTPPTPSTPHPFGLSRRAFLASGGLAAAAALVGRAPAAGATSEDGEPVPLPETAFGPPIPEKGYLVEEIAGGLYWVTEGSYQAIFMETRRGVVVVDAPPTLAAGLPAAIAEVTTKPVTHFIYSHTHGDHVGAAGVLFPDAIKIGHRDTAATLARRADPKRPVPDRTFSTSTRVSIDGRRLDLSYPGPNHEPGNSFIYAPEQKTLMLVDVIFPGWVPFKDLALAKDVPGYTAVHDAALEFDFDTFVGGHLTRLGTREDVEIAREYNLDVRAASLDAMASVDFFGVVGEIGFLDPSDPSFLNQWELFDTYLNALASHAEEAVLAKWLYLLGGADIWTHDHCFAMIEAIRIDENAVAAGL